MSVKSNFNSLLRISRMSTVEGPTSKVDDKSSGTSSAGSTPSLDSVSNGISKGPPMNGDTVKDVKDMKDGHTRRLNLKMSFRTLSSPKKVDKPKLQDKNEPSRFLGEGVSFKAKLIGILEVSEARGDRMCQEALGDLKMAIRAAGEHKQRININIAIDGLRLRDEKNGDCLYHHPVHKISFIAQDMSDSRAFGYIFGSPDTGHRFFGIKTDKAASQVVIAMRDLFQVVFELKKKEIEMAKQHIEQHQIKIGGGLFVDSSTSAKSGVGGSDLSSTKVRSLREESIKENGSVTIKSSHKNSEVIENLLDLEFELNSIQQGIHQMERITPSDPFGPSSNKDAFGNDPFGDSFKPKTTIPPPPKTVKQSVMILPPPAAAKDPSPRSDPFNVPPPSRQPQRRGGVRNRAAATERFNAAVASIDKRPAGQETRQQKHWFDQETESLFGEGELVSPLFVSNTGTSTLANLPDMVVSDIGRESPTLQAGQFDVFMDLDPLGTGRRKPYIDRKDFFQDLKNPPKKVLKDLVTEAPSEIPLFQATFDSENNRNSNTSETTDPHNISNNSEVASFPTLSQAIDPFNEVDPFYRTDPFHNADVIKIAAFPPNSADPFDTGFADFTMFGPALNTSANGLTSHDVSTKRTSPLLQSDASQPAFSPQTNFHGPLRVSLPPEKPGANLEEGAPLPPFPSSSRQVNARLSGTVKQRTKSRLHKQTTLSELPKLPSPKSAQRSNRLIKQMTVDGCSSKPHTLHPATPPTPQRYDRRSPASHLESVTLRNRCAVTPSPPIVACFPDSDVHSSRLSGSSIEFSEIAPEPPPRPATNVAPIKPPPLPPKRQQAGHIMRPPPRPPHSDDQPHYDYIENYETSSSPTPQDGEELKSPPIPVPARRPRFGLEDLGTAPQRPKRNHTSALFNKSSEDDYLTPTPFPLLPPPQKRNQDSKSQICKPQMAAPPVPTSLNSLFPTSETERKPEHTASTSLNLTLSQLTKTGFSDLATVLGISAGQLSNMTLQELTKCLSKLSTEPSAVAEETTETVEKTNMEKGIVRREKYATLRESVDEEPIFKAEFENNFNDSIDIPVKQTEEVFQETLFDKYAVFRELISEAKTEEQPEEAEEDMQEMETIPVPIATEENNVENASNISGHSEAITREYLDRYAALRDISLDDCPDDGEALSDREESLAEVVKVEEDDDLLTLSRQHSESTESPTMESTTLREPLSIMETTIYEEDVSTLEADNDDALEEVPDIVEDGEEIEEEEEEEAEAEAVVQEESLSTIGSKESIDKVQEPIRILKFSSSLEKEELRGETSEPKLEDEDPNSESWAKFDAGAFPPTKLTLEGHREEVASPWSSEDAEVGKKPTWQESFDQETESGRRGRMQRRSPWQEEELEEGCRERQPRDDGPWRENGWSDGEAYYDDGPPPMQERVYHEDRRGRRRRVSPWKTGQRSSRDTSPWEHGRYQDHSMDDEEDDEEYEAYWKTRPKNRGLSWDDERRRRYEPRDVNGLDYEEGRKRRPSPWSGEGDRRSSRESVNWEDENRFYGDRRPRDREEEYRRRREPDGYAWPRKGEGNHSSRSDQSRRSQDEGRRYYRDRSHESPWEDEYSEQGDDDEPQYQNTKRSWTSKRPSSASDQRRTSDKSPGEFKNRALDKPQYSLPAARGERDGGDKMGLAERRYRDKCGGRPPSRDGHFNSDQEYEYWPQPERSRREGGYEQRSQTLHTRKPNKYKKTQERSYSQKSPFDDDFTSHPLSVSSSDIVKSQGGESDASDSFRKKSSPVNPAGLFTYADALPRRRDQYPEDIRPSGTPSSPFTPRDSPLEDAGMTRASRGSNRQSPFEDDFTPSPEPWSSGGRRVSSVSSDVSDHRRSPYEDIRGGRRVPSVAEEKEGDNDAADFKNGRISDEVFLPGDNVSDLASEKRFGDFDNGAFNSSLGNKGSSERRVDRRLQGVLRNEESKKSEKCLNSRSRIVNLKVDPLNIKKSESVNIFTREKDPFDDDDFFSSETAGNGKHPRSQLDQRATRSTERSNNNNGEHLQWTKAFDSFNFGDEK